MTSGIVEAGPHQSRGEVACLAILTKTVWYLATTRLKLDTGLGGISVFVCVRVYVCGAVSRTKCHLTRTKCLEILLLEILSGCICRWCVWTRSVRL